MELVEGDDLSAIVARPSTLTQGVPSTVEGRGPIAISEAMPGSAAPMSAAAATPPPVSLRAQWLRVGLAIAAGAVVTALAMGWVMRPKAAAPAVVARFEMSRWGRRGLRRRPGRRFLFVGRPKNVAAERPRLVVVQHWFDELRARVPVSTR